MRRLASRLLTLVIVGLAASAFVMAPAGAEERGCANDDGCVLAINVNGLIDDVVIDFVDTALADVETNDRYLAVILVVNSSGTVVTDPEFERFVDRIENADVGVSAWVGPSGAAAGGGAAELVLALDGSTMAPATRIGSIGQQRLPVGTYGDWFDDGNADLRTDDISAGEAADRGLVAGVAATLGDHAVDIDGIPTETITDSEGRPKRQLAADRVTQTLPVTTQLFHTAASPAIAYLMLGLAIGLLLFEFFTAGVGIAGVVGAVCALLAGYGLAALPTRPWALALCLLSAIAFAVDIQTAIPRFWTAAGLIMWTVGSVWLFDGIRAPLLALMTGIVGMATTMFSGMPSMVRSRFATADDRSRIDDRRGRLRRDRDRARGSRRGRRGPVEGDHQPRDADRRDGVTACDRHRRAHARGRAAGGSGPRLPRDAVRRAGERSRQLAGRAQIDPCRSVEAGHSVGATTRGNFVSALPSYDSWQNRGACRGPHATVFFPPPQFERKVDRAERENRAREICSDCPVAVECLEYALEIREPHGIWGGLNEAERRMILDERSTATA